MNSRYGNKKNNKLRIVVAMLFAQLFLFAADAFAFENFFGDSSVPHHDVCIENVSACQPDKTAINEINTENCDHCCLCHGHSSHLVLFKVINNQLGEFGEMALTAYRTFSPSHLQPDIDRPPRA